MDPEDAGRRRPHRHHALLGRQTLSDVHSPDTPSRVEQRSESHRRGARCSEEEVSPSMTCCTGCFKLEQRVMDLEAQVRDYKLLLTGAPVNFQLGLTKTEAEIVQALATRSPECLTVEMIYNLLYGG